ncbi:S24 family peptidase [Prevotella sp. S7-1-8]|uniref:S24 family peptidase n=2 Tax=unclassified Prevotella TaxID=2638335 RepID=UPI00055C9262|nr:S24 family peptidase [Prevotella sp. S7-1-8]
MQNILSRIQAFVAQESITIGALERKIGASKGVLSRAIKNDTDIQAKWLSIIVENYPLLSGTWLLTGKGSMYKEDSLIPTNSSDGIPLIPTEAMAGLFAGSQTVMLSECERFIVPSFRNADFLITVRGDSMQPHYFSGDLVACKMLSLTDIFFQWGKVYVIDTEQGALIKKIEQGSTPESILLVSANPAYKPFEISRSSIYHIAIVQGVIREE